MMLKKILIVGASKGIGAELVSQFSSLKSIHVIALARNIETQNNWSEKDNISVHNFDLNSSSMKDELSEILSKHDQIDYVINNAGLLVNKPFLELTDNDIYTSYDVNVIGVMKTLQVVLPKMFNAGGHVVNVSSMGGFQGTVKFSGLSAYSSSKAALVNLTEMLAEEFKETKVKFNCLCLGAVQTEMLEKAFPGYQAPITAEKMAEYIVDFSLNAHNWLNGKIIPVSMTTP
jgi:short-subunit dehydrogenase